MNKRLFLHVGPPKTGTTSLQVSLENLEHPEFVFCGVSQPRTRQRIDLAQRLHHATLSDALQSSKDAKRAIAEVKDHIDQGRHVVMSEELFMVSAGPVTWLQKMERLRAMFAAIPVTVVITLRDPMKGLPSLYQEILPSLPFREQLSFRAFCFGRAAECYDFQHVLNKLTEIGFSDIRCFTFDDLTSNTLTTKDFFGSHDCFDEQVIAVGRHNVGKKEVGRPAEREIAKVTLRSLAQARLVDRFLELSRIRQTFIGYATGSALEKIVVKPAGRRTLEVPDKVSASLAVSYYRAIENWVKDRNAN